MLFLLLTVKVPFYKNAVLKSPKKRLHLLQNYVLFRSFVQHCNNDNGNYTREIRRN